MPTPPTYVTSYTLLPGTTTSPQSIGGVVNGNAADIIAGSVIGWSDNGNDNYTITSSPAETFIEGVETGGSINNDVWMQAVTAILAASRTGMNITATRTVGGTGIAYGQVWSQWRNSDGIGTTQASQVSGQSAPSLVINTQYDNSAIFYVVGDWSDDGNAARTHRSNAGASAPVEAGHFNNASEGSCTWAYILDAGTAGAKTVGMSAPTGRDSLVVAIEIRGMATPAPKGFLYTEDGFVIRSESGKGLRR